VNEEAIARAMEPAQNFQGECPMTKGFVDGFRLSFRKARQPESNAWFLLKSKIFGNFCSSTPAMERDTETRKRDGWRSAGHAELKPIEIVGRIDRQLAVSDPAITQVQHLAHRDDR